MDFEILFGDLAYNFKFKKMYNIHRYYSLRPYLITKIKYFTIYGHKFSHISEMNFTFKTNHNNITYEYYLKQRKSMLEWRLIEKLARNLKLIKQLLELFHIHEFEKILTSIQ